MCIWISKGGGISIASIRFFKVSMTLEKLWITHKAFTTPFLQDLITKGTNDQLLMRERRNAEWTHLVYSMSDSPMPPKRFWQGQAQSMLHTLTGSPLVQTLQEKDLKVTADDPILFSWQRLGGVPKDSSGDQALLLSDCVCSKWPPSSAGFGNI